MTRKATSAGLLVVFLSLVPLGYTAAVAQSESPDGDTQQSEERQFVGTLYSG